MSSLSHDQSYRRYPSNPRGASRAMQHYYEYNERQRPPSYFRADEPNITPPRAQPRREFISFADPEYQNLGRDDNGYSDDIGTKQPSTTTVDELPPSRDDDNQTPSPQRACRNYSYQTPSSPSIPQQSSEKQPRPHLPNGNQPSPPTPPSQHRRHPTDPLSPLIPSISKETSSTVNSFFTAYFTALLSLSTLGSSITFTFILNSSIRKPPPSSPFSTTHLQALVALAWLFFILTLAFTAACQTLLKFYSKRLEHAWDAGGERRKWAQILGLSIAAALLALVIGAFVFLSLIVAAYTKGVGFTALGFTVFFGFGGLGGIVYQYPVFHRKGDGRRRM
ncbi:MAG: hypothetical protein Q9227_007361 [Pyrenula ochraceoflavens]